MAENRCKTFLSELQCGQQKCEMLPAQRRRKTDGQRREAFLTTEPTTDTAGTYGEQPIKEAYR